MSLRRLTALAATISIAASGLIIAATPAAAVETISVTPSPYSDNSQPLQVTVNGFPTMGSASAATSYIYWLEFSNMASTASIGTATCASTQTGSDVGVVQAANSGTPAVDPIPNGTTFNSVTYAACEWVSPTLFRFTYGVPRYNTLLNNSSNVTFTFPANLFTAPTSGTYSVKFTAGSTQEYALSNWCFQECGSSGPGETPPPPDTLDFDGNGGTCSPTSKSGDRGTWSKALTADNCSKPGEQLMGFSTSPTNSGNSVFVSPGGPIYFGGSNRLYAIWSKPAVPAGAPTDVVAVAGRNKVTVSWKEPANDGGGQISNYLVQAKPSNRACVTQAAAANSLSCTIDLPATNTKYTFTAQALNNAGWGDPSAASNAVSPFDLVLGEASREKQGVVLGVWLGGSTISALGRAPGFAPGTAVTPQLKVGASGSWVSETKDLPKVNASGTVSWSKKLPRSANSQPVAVRFAIGSDTSNSYAMTVGAASGVPTAPRNVKVTTTVDGKLRVAWQPPASAGGSDITRYVVTSDLPEMASCPVSGDKTECIRAVRTYRVDPNRTYQFSVVARNETGASKPGTATWRGQVSNLYINFLRSNPNWSGKGEEVTLRVSADGYKPGTKLTVEMRVGENGAWKKQKGDLVLDFEYNDREWVGIVDAALKGKPVYFRVTGPQGTTAPKLLTWAGGARG